MFGEGQINWGKCSPGKYPGVFGGKCLGLLSRRNVWEGTFGGNAKIPHKIEDYKSQHAVVMTLSLIHI